MPQWRGAGVACRDGWRQHLLGECAQLQPAGDTSLAQGTTALFEDEAIDDLLRYGLAQLRGPNNEPVFEAMKAFARRVAREMNAPSNAERRRLARQAVRDAEKKPQPPVPEFDDESIAALPSLLALSPR